MDLNQFITKLKHYTRRKRIKWLGNGGNKKLRAQAPSSGLFYNSASCCPITIFFGKDANYVNSCASKLGLSSTDKDAIVGAADNGCSPNPSCLRRRLMKACGVTA